MANRKNLLYGGGIVVVGVVVAAMVVKMVAANTTTIEVANANIPMGTKITSTMVGSKLVHEDGLDPGVLPGNDRGKIVGQYAIEPIQNGQQLTTFNVGMSPNALDKVIPKGMVGITIPADSVTGFSGGLSTGTRVDILGTVFKASSQGQSQPITGYLQKNALVIQEEFDSINTSTVVGVQLAVHPKVAQELQEIIANPNGQGDSLRLVVPGAHANVNMKPLSASQLVQDISK